MKFWKGLALLLAVLLVIGMTACSGDGDTNTTTTTSAQTQSSGDTDATTTTVGGGTETTTTVEGDPSGETNTATTTASKVTTKPTDSNTVDLNDFSDIRGTTVRIHYGSQLTDEEKAYNKRFEEKYGCKVEPVIVAWAEIHTKIVQMVSSGTPMDYVKLSDQNFVNYVAKKLIQPIDSYIDLNNQYCYKPFMDMFMWEDKHYFMYSENSILSHYAFIFYNKTMFEDEGVKEPYEWYQEGKWTFEQFRKTAQEMTKDTNHDGKTDVYGFGTWWYEGLLLANGNSQVVLNQDGTIDITLQQKSAYTALQLIEDMQLVDHSYDWAANVTELFMNSQMAMVLERPWEAVGAYKMYDDNYFPDEIGFCPAPTGPDTGDTVYAPTLIHGYAIPMRANNPRGAVAWFLEDAAYNESRQNDPKVLSDRRRMISDEHREIALEYIANTTPLCSFSNSIGSWDTGKWEMWAGILRDNIPPATIVAQKVNLLQTQIDLVLSGKNGDIND